MRKENFLEESEYESTSSTSSVEADHGSKRTRDKDEGNKDEGNKDEGNKEESEEYSEVGQDEGSKVESHEEESKESDDEVVRYRDSDDDDEKYRAELKKLRLKYQKK
jgi:hypothetical protein